MHFRLPYRTRDVYARGIYGRTRRASTTQNATPFPVFTVTVVAVVLFGLLSAAVVVAVEILYFIRTHSAVQSTGGMP